MEKKDLGVTLDKKMTFAELHGALLHVVREYRAFAALEDILRQAKTIEQDLRELEKTKQASEVAHLSRQQELLAAEEETQKQIAMRIASTREQAEHDTESTRATVANVRKELAEYQVATALAKASLDHDLAEKQKQLQDLQETIERVSRQGQLDLQKLENQKLETVRAHEEQRQIQQTQIAQLETAIVDAHTRLANLQAHIRGLHSSLESLAG